MGAILLSKARRRGRRLAVTAHAVSVTSLSTTQTPASMRKTYANLTPLYPFTILGEMRYFFFVLCSQSALYRPRRPRLREATA